MKRQVINIPVESLPAGYIPLEMTAVVKCLDEDGEPVLVLRHSDGIMAWEVVGMLLASSDAVRADLLEDLQESQEEDHDGGDNGAG